MPSFASRDPKPVSARFLSHKAGSGRIKHMGGKYLFLQQLVANQELDVKKIATLTNTSDLGTKGPTPIGCTPWRTWLVFRIPDQTMMSKELMKQELTNMCRQISQSQETSCRTPSTNTVNMQIAGPSPRLQNIVVGSPTLSILSWKYAEAVFFVEN